MTDIVSFKQTFDQQLADYLTARIAGYRALCADDYVFSLIEHVIPLVVSGGKRSRPYIASLLYKANGGADDQVIRQLGFGLELFHTFCLIHDDIMDRGTRRHGAKTIHSFAYDTLPQGRVGDTAHLADSHAILVGDLVFSWAQECFRAAIGNRQEVWADIRQMIDEVTVGQMIDIDITTRNTVSEDLLTQKNVLKTASYSFVWPMLLGARLATPSLDALVHTFCKEFGMHFGMAFQIQDDLLDLLGDPAKTKKDVLSDIRDRQHTYLTHYIFTHGSEQDVAILMSWFGKQISISQEEAIAFFERTGALSYVQGKMNAAFTAAQEQLDDAPVTDDCISQLRALFSYIRSRMH